MYNNREMYRRNHIYDTENRRSRRNKHKVVDIEDISKSLKEDGIFCKYLRIHSEGLKYEYPKIMRKKNEIFSHHHHHIIDCDMSCLVCMESIKKTNTLRHYCGFSSKRPIIKGCCKQYYHVDCYFNWLEENHICPICKNVVMTLVNLEPSNGRYKVNSYRTSTYKCYDCFGRELDKREFLRRTKDNKIFYIYKKQ